MFVCNMSPWYCCVCVGSSANACLHGIGLHVLIQVGSCSNLERLTIRDSPGLVTDRILHALGDHCPNLTHLNIALGAPHGKGRRANCRLWRPTNDKVTDAGLSALTTCRRLEECDLTGQQGFGNAGVIELATCCSNLKLLCLNGNKR